MSYLGENTQRMAFAAKNESTGYDSTSVSMSPQSSGVMGFAYSVLRKDHKSNHEAIQTAHVTIHNRFNALRFTPFSVTQRRAM